MFTLAEAPRLRRDDLSKSSSLHFKLIVCKGDLVVVVMIDLVRFFKIRFYLIFASLVDFALKSTIKVTWVPYNT